MSNDPKGKDITIEEAKKLLAELETEMASLIRDFHKKTLLTVEEIKLEKFYSLQGGTYYAITADVKFTNYPAKVNTVAH